VCAVEWIAATSYADKQNANEQTTRTMLRCEGALREGRAMSGMFYDFWQWLKDNDAPNWFVIVFSLIVWPIILYWISNRTEHSQFRGLPSTDSARHRPPTRPWGRVGVCKSNRQHSLSPTSATKRKSKKLSSTKRRCERYFERLAGPEFEVPTRNCLSTPRVHSTNK
jgi:hypothetical protein